MNGARIEFRFRWLVPAIVLVAFGGLTSQATASFSPATNFNVGGGSPLQVVTADVNGDNRKDLITADSGSDEISVLLGDGAGGFATPSLDVTVGSDPRSLAAGDLNDDNKVDVVTANYDDDTLSILLGHGDGTFDLPYTEPTGSQPSAVAVGKLDSNDTVDLAVASYSDAKVSTYAGLGMGSFALPVDYPVELYPRAVGIGRFNADARADLAVANSGGDSISVLLATGDASYSPAVRYPTGSATGSGLEPNSLAVAKLTGDDNLDLATANTYSDDISVLIGTGNGTFGAAGNFATADAPAGVAVGNLSEDPFADVAVASPGLNVASVLPGNGSGSFGVSVADLITGGTPKSLLVDDLDGDGKPDIVAANSLSDSISVFLNQAASATASPASLAFPAQARGTTSAAKTVTVSNNGTDPLKVLGAEVAGSGSFAVSGNDCPSSGVPGGGTCKVSVRFSPEVTGAIKAPLQLNYNGPASPLVVPLSGTGTAVAPKINCKVRKKKKRGKVKSVKATCKVTPASASAGKRYSWSLKKRGKKKVLRKGKTRAKQGKVTFLVPRSAKLKKGKYRLTVKGGGTQSTSNLTL